MALGLQVDETIERNAKRSRCRSAAMVKGATRLSIVVLASIETRSNATVRLGLWMAFRVGLSCWTSSNMEVC